MTNIKGGKTVKRTYVNTFAACNMPRHVHYAIPWNGQHTHLRIGVHQARPRCSLVQQSCSYDHASLLAKLSGNLGTRLFTTVQKKKKDPCSTSPKKMAGMRLCISTSEVLTLAIPSLVPKLFFCTWRKKMVWSTACSKDHNCTSLQSDCFM